jgi:hypothetical protein
MAAGFRAPHVSQFIGFHRIGASIAFVERGAEYTVWLIVT